ncbi:MAG TPA: condensation domain-containing protein, partial [Thermoanaerobaculia bacterium]|nr:condensation domain-containing protein [Thermoanaerobaculia bacterium]
AAIALRPTDRPAGEASPHTLAYSIYTSGSTGRPKGVQVEHRSALHLLAALKAAVLAPLAGAGLLPAPLLASLNAPMIFDASVQQLVLLLAGHALCVVPEDLRADGAALLDFLREQGVDLLDCTPSQLRLLVSEGLLDGPTGPRIVLTAGEAVDEPLWRRLAQAERTVCFNLYGPTECSVDATFHRVEQGSRKPTIGRPLPGYEVFLLDHVLRPVPPGAPGEIFLGGAGLSRGYLRRPILTAERFMPHPFAQTPGERLYRTGDLGRHLPDGSLEFLGRLDHQVKIRGFRIELGEIEAVLGEQAGVRQAVVVARESPTSDRRLVAYVAGDSAAVSEGALRRALRERLPDYMVPAGFVVLAALPLTPNGKVDRKALPAPEQPGAREDHVEPRTREEEILAGVWAQVLRLPRVGVTDNFFELGGDSILSVQIVARSRQAGLRFTVRQIFEHQTVAELAHHATAAEGAATVASQGPVAGEVPLTPIQHSFFAQRFADFHLFNQGLLLESREPLSPAALECAMAAIVEHHDALRMRFHSLTGDGDTGAWRQENAAAEPATPFHHVDLSSLPASHLREAFERAAAALQAGFDLSAGPLTRLCMADFGDTQPARLLWIAHHLIVDGVSWRVLLEDLEGTYRQAVRGLHPTLPPKTTSFQEWAQRLEKHASDPALELELPWWRQEAEAPFCDLPCDHPDGENTEASARRVSVALSADETRALLQEVPAVYRTQINEVLLTALARALAGPGRALLVELEGHGREEIFDGVDLSRTVGWFTSLFPVRLEAGPAGDPGAALRGVKEHLRTVPRRGIGYGLLRWVRSGDAATRELCSLLRPAVTFNYLGQFDGTASESSLFAVAGEATGATRSARGRRSSQITVDSVVTGGRLRINWIFSANLHEQSTVEVWAEEFLARLRELIVCCREAAARRTAGYTPSDFPLAGIGQQELVRLLGTEWGIEDVYPLSPVQEGILFHSLFEVSSGAYVGQLICTLRGDHDARLLEAACQRVVDHHPLLRTSFHWQGLERPLQVVHGEAAVPLEQEDWRGLASGELQRHLEEL